METHRPPRRGRTLCLLAVTLAPLAGCIEVERRGEKLYNSLVGVDTVVVAPMMNLSTNREVDLVEVTNTFVSELQQVEGLTVVPLGRVYQFLAGSRMATVGSPDEARELARVFKAQACIVGAVTEFDPYNPPRMGLAVQMYAAGEIRPATGTAGFDPVEAGRSGVPFAVSADALRPRDVLSRVYSGRNREVEILAKRYSRERLADDSPFGWRRFIVDQHEFVRLCSYGIIREMMGRQGRAWQLPRINVGPEAGKWPK